VRLVPKAIGSGWLFTVTTILSTYKKVLSSKAARASLGGEQLVVRLLFESHLLRIQQQTQDSATNQRPAFAAGLFKTFSR
jgi:hypothetical protein